MQITDIQLSDLEPAPWNSNRMDSAMQAKLNRSVKSFGLVEPLVVRCIAGEKYEIIGGTHRYQVLQEMGTMTAPCVIVQAGDARAILLGQALNNIEGEEDPVMRAASFRRILSELVETDIVSMLPVTSESLAELSGLGSLTPEMYTRSWQARKKTRLRHFPFRVTQEQLELIEEAIAMAAEHNVAQSWNPNARSNALIHICKQFIAQQTSSIAHAL